MKIDLNSKEFVALFGFLEKHAPFQDPKMDQVHKRITSVLVNALQCDDKKKFDKWFDVMQARVNSIKEDDSIHNEEVNILSDDNNEISSTEQYPKRARRHRK